MRRRLLLCAVVLGTTLMMPMMAQRLTPPVPYYKTGFEEMETQTFVDDTVEIEGVRWRIVNGRIVDDPKANIPFGKKALELTAGYVGDVPAMIEALDPIRGTQVSVSYMQGWTDALVSNAGKSWFAQESFDGGKSWGEKELIFDATTISTDLYERIDPDAFRFRIIFNDPDKTKGVGWRIMLDNIAFYDTGEGSFSLYDLEEPAEVSLYSSDGVLCASYPSVAEGASVSYELPEGLYLMVVKQTTRQQQLKVQL